LQAVESGELENCLRLTVVSRVVLFSTANNGVLWLVFYGIVSVTIQYKLLQATECELLITGIRRVYGKTYPVPEFYDPGYLHAAITANKLHCVVAMSSAQQVVGCMSTVVEQPGDFTADGSALMVAPEYRGQGIVAGLGEKMVETYSYLGLGGLHLYALALHDLVQKQSQNAGAVVTGALPAWFAKNAKVEGYDYPDARIGAVTLFMPLAPLPTRVCYVPGVYAQVLNSIYDKLALNRSFVAEGSAAPAPARSVFSIEEKPDNAQLRIVLERTGSDFLDALDQAMVQLNREEYEVIYLDIPLNDPATNYAVAQARGRGFFFGALMVDRRGCDRLRLQNYDCALAAPEAMVVASDEARLLLDYILADSEDVSAPITDYIVDS
jgi:hypothetical protein